MELNLTNKQKILLEGIIRSSVFLVAMREVYFFIMEHITTPIMGIAVNCLSEIDCFLNPEAKDNGIDILDIIAICIIGVICLLFNTYIIAKFCGLLKYFSQFKFWKSFLCLLLISYIYYYFSYLNLHTFTLNFDAKDAGGSTLAPTIIPAYLAYLFLNFLTKKFPTPFEQIGYFFSSRFYINLYKKYLKKDKQL